MHAGMDENEIVFGNCYIIPCQQRDNRHRFGDFFYFDCIQISDIDKEYRVRIRNDEKFLAKN